MIDNTNGFNPKELEDSKNKFIIFSLINIPKGITNLPVNLWVAKNNVATGLNNFNYKIIIQNDYEPLATLSNIISIKLDEINDLKIKTNLLENDYKKIREYINQRSNIFLKHNQGMIKDDELINKLKGVLE